MSRNLVVEFTKMHGAGNDFVVLDNRFLHFTEEELSDIAQKMCPRRFGIGADGLLAFENLPDGENVDFRMRYVNADGSPATMCGNGARCLAQFAVRSGVPGPDVSFLTDAGVYRAVVGTQVDANASGASHASNAAGRVRLFVPEPERWTPSFALTGELPAGLDDVHFVWTGTEHLVAAVDDVDAAPLDEWGPRLRSDDALEPTGANLNLVSFAASDSQAEAKDARIHVRTFEKGVEAETLACGTGVLASAVATARLNGFDVAERRLHVSTRGGGMTVGRADSPDRTDHLYLEGPVAAVFRGTFEWGGLNR